MNQERIIELYATVWLEVTKGVHPDDWYNTEIEHKIAVKFAELIIRECAKFLDDNSGYDDCNNAWHPEPEDLLEHFGVEQ